MNADQLKEVSWTVRLAPFFLIMAQAALLISLFRVQLPLAYSATAILLGFATLYSDLLIWRSISKSWRLAQVASFFPVSFLSIRLHEMEVIQFLALFFIAYGVGILAFRRQILTRFHLMN
jgi:hypothetical protein